MKKVLSVALCLMLLLGTVAVGGEGLSQVMDAVSLKAGAETYGVMTYQIIDGGVIITDCDESAAGALEIPSVIDGYPVTSIGNDAFSDCTGLTSVAIPDSVTSISGYAFEGCTGLTSITIPDSITSISNYAFYGCTGLTSIEVDDRNTVYHSAGNCLIKTKSKTLVAGCNNSAIPADGSVTSIGAGAFYGCTGLTSVTIPDSVTSIGDRAFERCTGLTGIIIPDSVTSIGRDAFKGCTGLTSVTIPDSVTSIEGAFWGCIGLTSITIPDSVTSIGKGAFYDCAGLTEVTIPDSVTSIGYDAFKGCTGLTSITIPDSVTSIERFAFEGCTGLTSVTIGNSVTSIGDMAFSDCTGLTEVTIPDSVTSIGDSAFWGCAGLTSIAVDEGNTVYHSAENCLIETESKTIIAGCKNSVIPDDGSVTSIDSYAFSGCTGLTDITIPDSVTSIGEDAFYHCTGLTSVTIPDSVTSIERLAFEGCTGLTSVTIPDSVTSIERFAFEGCTGLTSVTIGNGVTNIGSRAFSGCTGLTSIEVDEGNTVYHSAGNCLIETESKTLVAGCKNSVIPDGGSVTSIGVGVFYGCTGLTSITIPDSVTSIGNYAFYGCTGLTSVIIGNGVTSIGEGAFDNCPLEYVKMGNGLTSIPSTLIHKDSLKTFIIGGGVTGIGVGAFFGCTELTSIEVDEGNTVYHSAGNCVIETESKTLISGCKNSVIPADGSVTSIGYGAFYDCAGLTSVTIGNGVTNIGSRAFSGCTGLTDVYFTGTEEEWNAITIGEENDDLLNAVYHNLIFNLGEETYSFKNFSGGECCDMWCRQPGHCFGMAMTCAGYYTGDLDRPKTGFESGSLYAEPASAAIKDPIHYYQVRQGKIVEESTVAGGSGFKNLGTRYDPSSDWSEVTDYVKNHDYDNKGSLQIGFKGSIQVNSRKRNINHAVNFLYYKEVDGQQRIYAYDNEYPDRETYFYKDSSGKIYQSVGGEPVWQVECIALRDVSLYLSKAGKFDPTKYFYAENGAIIISNSTAYFMETDNEDAEEVIIEVPDGVTEVTIIPQEDNATFQYMGVEYSFDKVDDDTVGKFILAVTDEDGSTIEQPVFEIENDSELKALTEAKEAAKAEIDKAVPADASDAVKALAETAKKNIDAATSADEVNAAKKNGIDAINVQLASESATAPVIDGFGIVNGSKGTLNADYKSTVIFHTTVKAPDGYKTVWSNGQEGDECKFTATKSEYKISAKLVNISTGETVQTTEEVTVKVSATFIAKIIAFFKGLFNMLPTYVDFKKQ